MSNPVVTPELLKHIGLLAYTLEGNKQAPDGGMPEQPPVAPEKRFDVPAPGNTDASAMGAQNRLVQTGQDVRDEANKTLSVGDQQTTVETAAAQQKFENDTAAQQAAAPIFKRELGDIERFDSEYADYIANSKKQQAAGMDRYLTAVEDLKNTHVYSWWASAGTGATVLGIISQALAGGLQGMNGQSGPTPLDRVIEQELALQKVNFENKSDVARQTGGIFKDLMAQTKDASVAEAAVRDIALNSVKVRIEAKLGMLDGKAKEGALQLLAGIAAKRTALRADMSKHFATLATTTGVESANLMEKFAALQGTKDIAAEKAAGEAQQHESAGLVAPDGKPIVGSERLLNAVKNTDGAAAAKQIRDDWNSALHIHDSAKAIIDVLSNKVTDPITGKTITASSEMRSSLVAAKINQNLAQIKTDLAVAKRLRVSSSSLALLTDLVGMSGGWDAIIKSKTPGFRSASEFAQALADISNATRKRIEQNLRSASVGGKTLDLPSTPDLTVPKE